jgi:hypothetical protein
MLTKKRSLWIGMASLGVGALLSVIGWSSVLRAAEVLVTAEFKPSASDPTAYSFINTTPRGQYCRWVPNQCLRANIYMFDLPITLTKTYTKGGDVRQRWYVAFPAKRQVTLTNATGHTANATIAIAAYSGHTTPGNSTNPTFTVGVRGGCAYVYTAGGSWVRFGWSVRDPAAPQPCHSQGDGGGQGFTGQYHASTLGIGMEIATDSPLSLRNGVYEGTLTYTAGGMGADFDFGDDAVVSDSFLVFNFKFTVVHELAVDFPAGSDRAVLVPEGGWSNWIDRGHLPTRLTRELPFSLSNSLPFSVTLQCEHTHSSGECGLRDVTTSATPEVPVEVAITMPGLRETSSNSPALNWKLSTQPTASRFMADAYVSNRASHLEFNVKGEHVKEILDHPGSKYRGNVTLIFDAQP